MLNIEQITEILCDVRYPGFEWHIRGDFADGRHVTLHASFLAVDNDMPIGKIEHKTRKWLLSRHMTKSEIVQTALKCVLTAIEHEARERFTYRGERVFGPHISIDELLRLACEKRTEVRP